MLRLMVGTRENMRRLGFVDSLRGLAALYVVMPHMVYMSRPNLPLPHWAQTIVPAGGVGVTLFFVISAFSLCETMKPRAAAPHEARDFYIRRFFRIAPLFYVVLAFYLVYHWLALDNSHGLWQVAKNLLFIFNFFPGSEQGIVSASWTIGVEMVFYAVFPFLFARIRNAPAALGLFFGSLFVMVTFREALAYVPMSPAMRDPFFTFSFLRHLPVFAFGMVCWLIFDRQIRGGTYPAAVGIALILGSLWAFHAQLHGALNVLFPDPYYWQPIICTVLLLGLGIAPVRVLVNAATLFCGRISYSIYLLHPVVILFLAPAYARIEALAMPVSARFLLCVAVTLGAVLPLGWLSYRYIEAPGMNLGKRLLATLSEREKSDQLSAPAEVLRGTSPSVPRAP
jgi:peptidoglycan/LPS O-acetylase OafA/YrhL